MLRNTKIGRPDRQRLPAPPTINDFNHFLNAAQKLSGRWVDFSWTTAGGKMFTVSVAYNMGMVLPVWRLYGGDENNSLQWEHQSCDVPLIFNLVAAHADMADRVVQAEGALSRTRGSLGADEAHSEFYKLAAGDPIPVVLPAQGGNQPDDPAKQVEASRRLPAELDSSRQPEANAVQKQEELISAETGLLTYAGFLFVLEREYELSKRTNMPLALLVFSGHEKLESKDEALKAEGAVLSSIPYIAIAQRKSDVLAHYQDGYLALLLPNTTITGAKVAARRILRALDRAEDPMLASSQFRFAAVDVVNDAPTYNLALTAAQETSLLASRSTANVMAHRDVLMNKSAAEIADRLKQQKELSVSGEAERSALVARLVRALTSERSGAFIASVGRYFMEHDRRLALREKRNLAVLVFDVAVKPQDEANAPGTDALFTREILKCLSKTMRKVDILTECSQSSFALVLPDASLTGVRNLAQRMKELAHRDIPAILGPGLNVRLSMSTANVMDQCPKLNFQAI